MQRLQRIRNSLRFCLVQRDFDSNSSSKVLILFLVVRFVLINSRSLSKRDFVPRRNVSILIRVILRLVSQRRFTVELFMEKSKLAACGLMRFRGAFSKPLRVTSRRISVNPGACRWILMQRLDIDRCRRWRSREIFRWRSPSPQIYYHRPRSIPLSNEHLPILNRLESIPTTD